MQWGDWENFLLRRFVFDWCRVKRRRESCKKLSGAKPPHNDATPKRLRRDAHVRISAVMTCLSAYHVTMTMAPIFTPDLHQNVGIQPAIITSLQLWNRFPLARPFQSVSWEQPRRKGRETPHASHSNPNNYTKNRRISTCFSGRLPPFHASHFNHFNQAGDGKYPQIQSSNPILKSNPQIQSS